jgi:hypothetical protein
MSASEVGNVTTKTSFSSLPLELRRLIWVATFEPRTLTVEAHIVTPYVIGSRTIKPKHGTWCRTFTAKLGIHLNPKPRTTETWGGTFVSSQAAEHMPPPSPVALHVCRESRVIALENYRLAFHGSITCVRDHPSVLEWLGGLDQGKIWVDYKRDTIFYCNLVGCDPLDGFPDEEAAQVETLASYRTCALPMRVQKLGNYRSLRTFQVYDEYFDSKRVVEKLRGRLAQNMKEKKSLKLPTALQTPHVELLKYPPENEGL